MAKYYYKGQEILAPLDIVSNEPSFDVTTVSLKVSRATQGHQRWELGFNVVGTVDNEADMMLGTLTGLNVVETMEMPQLPSIVTNTTVDSNSLVINSDSDEGDTTVLLDVSGRTGILPKGAFFKFSTHDKVYVATSDVDFSQSTAQTLNFYPDLKEDITAAGTSLDVRVYVNVLKTDASPVAKALVKDRLINFIIK